MQGSEETFERERGGRGGHRHRHHHGGPEFPWGRHWRGAFGQPWPGRRARRGDIRSALLALIDERPLHGYDVIRELEERSGGMWHPSPGSVYPTLQLLEDQGLLTSEEIDGKRVYSITEAGRTELAERRTRADGAAPWETSGERPEAFGKLFGAMSQLGAAVMQVARAGGTDQVDRVTQILAEARKKVYAILAED